MGYSDTCHLPLGKSHTSLDSYLLNHHNTIISDGILIRDLCFLTENNIVVDDQDHYLH